MKDNIRQEWADIFKGIGIICVVLGHTFSDFTKDFIFAFHMPLFFFIGGYFLKPNHSKTGFLIKQSKGLLIPYFIFLVLLILPTIYWSLNKTGIAANWTEILARFILGGRYLIEYTSVFWFVTCYFITQQLANLFITSNSIKKVGVIVMIFMLAGYLNSEFFPEFWLPWNANVVALALPHFVIGYYFRLKNVRLNVASVTILFIVSFVLIYLIEGNTYDMKYANYGIPILTFFCGLSIVLFLVKCSKILVKTKVSRILSELGKASMVIMFLHQFIKIILIRKIGSDMVIIVIILALLLPYLLYKALLKRKLTRYLFLGKIR